MLVSLAGGRLAFEWPLSSSLSLRLHGDVVADLRRPTFTLDGKEAWGAPPVAGTLGVGALAHFP
jgi:hypothetical protein